jgi:hypothetical protein
MKAYFTILVILFSVFYCNAQDYDWEGITFIEKPSINNNATSAQFTIEDDDYKYITGRFEGYVDFQGSTLTSNNLYGAFIAKTDENDSLLWIRKFAESIGNSVIYSIRVIESDNNNIYLSISFIDTINVYGQQYIANQLVNEYSQSLILKFDEQGNVLNVFYLEGSCLKNIENLHIDEQQNIYFYGGYGNDTWSTTSSCTCIFDGTTYTTTSTDIFLAKYDSSGNLIWVNTLEANKNIYPLRFGIIENSIYLSGSVYNSNIPIDFGSYTLNYPTNYDKGGFMAKYDTSGSFKWVKYYGAKGWDSYVSSIDVEILNNNTIVVGGSVQTQSESAHLYFQNSSPLTRNSTGAEKNYFIIAYDSLGNIKWKDLAQCSGWDAIYGMSSDSKANLLVTGYYHDQFFFENDTLPYGYGYLWVGAFDSIGNKLWVKKIEGNGFTSGEEIEIDSKDNIYVLSGTTSNLITFGNTSYTINRPSVFIAKMTSSIVSSTTNIQAVSPNKELLKIVDILGRETIHKKNTLLFYIYNDGTVEKKVFVE